MGKGKPGTHEIEAQLPRREFRRIHRSSIVSLDKIDSYTAEGVEVRDTFILVGLGYRDVIESL